MTVTGVPKTPIDPAVEVKFTVPVAAFVVTFAELIEALDVNETVLVVPVPTVPARPSEPLVAVRTMLDPVTEVKAVEFKLPLAIKLNVFAAPEFPEIVVTALLSVKNTLCPAAVASADRFGADKDTGVPDTPIDPAVETKFTVPVAALRFNPPAKLDAFEILPEEVRLMMPVFATVPTEPASPSAPPVDVKAIVPPSIVAAALEFKLPAAVTLNVPAALELPVTVVVPALESVMKTVCPAPLALADRFAAESATGVPDIPTEPAVEVKFTVPAAFTLSPPEKLPALLMLPEELKVIELVLATVPTAAPKLRDPPVAVSAMLVPVIAAVELRLFVATMLKTAPAPDALLTVVVAALSDK